jgi:predicted RNase H-like nuclease
MADRWTGWVGSPEACPVPASYSGACRLAGVHRVDLVTIDMPVARLPFSTRRTADSLGSRAFGARGCGTHTPNASRPGPLGLRLSEAFSDEGYAIADATAVVGEPQRLVEVYPHPALLRLLGADYLVPYKVSKSLSYWPGTSVEERIDGLLDGFDRILGGLRLHIADIPVVLPQPSEVRSLAQLKRYEDTLDALVCAWVGTQYLAGRAAPYGDDQAAIWIPA